MPVIVIAKFEVDSIDQAKKVLESNAGPLDRLTRAAKSRGALSHRFCTDGSALIAVDTWTSPEDFHGFFDRNEEIADLLAQAGVRTEPIITTYDIVEASGTF